MYTEDRGTVNKRCLVIINFSYDLSWNTPIEALESCPQLTSWAEAFVAEEVSVRVFQRFSCNKTIKHRGVNYQFLADSLKPIFSSYHLPFSFNQRVLKYIRNNHEQHISVFIHSTLNALSILYLTALLRRKIQISIQHHAEPIPAPLKRFMLRLAGRIGINTFFLTTREHATPWVDHGIFTEDQCVTLMECTSTLTPKDKIQAKRELGINDLLLLWTGNLNSNKDPLTIIKAFNLFREKHRAVLLMVFKESDLLSEVQGMISNLKLENCVHQVGFVPHSEINQYFSAADIFIQGSSYEGSGISPLEAMSCGSVPVITSIPSFRKMTCNSPYLWRVGDTNALYNALCKLIEDGLKQRQEQEKINFELNWSANSLTKRVINLVF